MRTPGSFLAMLSLLLCVGTAALWVRGRRHADLLAFFTPAGKLQGGASFNNGFILFFSDVPFGREKGLTFDTATVPAEDFKTDVMDLLFEDPSAHTRGFAGFRLARGTLAVGALAPKYAAFRLPAWLPLSLTLVLPVRWLRRTLRGRKWMKRGWCAECGYDLRATPGRCPECGTDQPAPAPAAANG